MQSLSSAPDISLELLKTLEALAHHIIVKNSTVNYTKNKPIWEALAKWAAWIPSEDSIWKAQGGLWKKFKDATIKFSDHSKLVNTFANRAHMVDLYLKLLDYPKDLGVHNDFFSNLTQCLLKQKSWFSSAKYQSSEIFFGKLIALIDQTPTTDMLVKCYQPLLDIRGKKLDITDIVVFFLTDLKIISSSGGQEISCTEQLQFFVQIPNEVAAWSTPEQFAIFAGASESGQDLMSVTLALKSDSNHIKGGLGVLVQAMSEQGNLGLIAKIFSFFGLNFLVGSWLSSLKIKELVHKIEQKVSDHRAATTESVSCKTSVAAAVLVGGGVTVKAVPAKAVPALSYLAESSLQARKSEGGVNPSQ